MRRFALLLLCACHSHGAQAFPDGGSTTDGAIDPTEWALDLTGTIGASVSTDAGGIKDGTGHGLDATASAGLVFAPGHPSGVVGVAFPGSAELAVASANVASVADVAAGESFAIELGFRTASSISTLFTRPDGWTLSIVEGHLTFAFATGATLTLPQLVSDGRWHRAIVTRDTDAHEVRLTLDGAAVISEPDPMDGQAITGAASLAIGTGLLGAIDHVALRRHVVAAFSSAGTSGTSIIFRGGVDAVPGGGTYASIRIPSIVRANDGTLVVAAEGRVDSDADLGNIDLVVKRSTDNGRTWSALQRVSDAGANKVGNPILFADSDTDRLVLLSLVTPVGAGTPGVQVQHSDDHGSTWSAAVAITSSVMDPAWNTDVLVGPSHGIQLHTGPNAGTLVVAGQHRRASDNLRGGHLWISRDHGITWSIGAKENTSAPNVNVNESTAAELRDGRIYVNVRNSVTDVEAARATGIRGQAIVNSDLTFAAEPPFARTKTFRGPVVEGATFRWPGSARYGDEPRILFSFPGGEYGTNFGQRHDLKLYTSADDTTSFAPPVRIYGGKASYSDLVQLDDGRLGSIYETALDSEGFNTRIEFHVVPLEGLDDPTELAWTFEDATAAITTSTSRGSSPAKLTATGAVTLAPGQLHSTAAHFSGSRLCGTAAAIDHAADLGIHDGFEIEATFATTAHANGGSTASGALIAKTIVGTPSAWWLRVEDDKVRFAVGDDTGALDIVTSTESVSDGAFHTVIARRAIAAKQLQISIDGHAIATVPITTTSFVTNTEDLCIGAFADAQRPFTGEIDAVAFRLTE